MRGFRVLCLIMAIASPCLALSAVTAQEPRLDEEWNWHDLPPTYTLACRGPLNVEIGLNFSPPVTMQFRRGRKPATSGVDPGTCAWMDRGVSDREPECLQHYTRYAYVRITTPAPAPGPAAMRFRNEMLAERPSGMAGKAAPPAAPSPAPAPAGPPTVRLGSTGNATYLEFIATSSEKVAHFRAFALKGRSCLMIERPGP